MLKEALLTIQKTFDEFEELCADYAFPNSIVDIGNMYFYAGKFEELLKASLQREAKLREAVNLALYDMTDDAYYSAAERLEKALDDTQP